MVTTHTTVANDAALPDLAAALPRLTAEADAAGAALIAEAAQWVTALPDAATASGTARWQHALGTALQVAELHLDAESVAAALLSGAPLDVPPPIASAVLTLARGVAKMDAVGQLIAGEESVRRDGHNQVEGLRQMLLAMVEDVRVVLIKLAERAYTLRVLTQGGDEAARHQVAREVRELFAPLANRLGVWQIKWEMEDLSYRILEPDNYKRIARLLDEKRLDRERYIADVVDVLQKELTAAGIAAEVTGRPKHIVSIINKMNRKRLAFEQLYDIRAVRILVPELKDCYTALGLIHHLWQPISGEFDDYIANPKSNDYRSLHTGVIGPENKALEVQIRTFDMHRHAELGVAAHWRYKEGATKATGAEDKIAWLRQILQWKDEVADGRELAELFKNELFQDRIYVLTPQGRVIDLAAGASPVDFAYHVHSDLGHRCRGAKVDGVIVPLNTPLKNGQRVEILTVKQGTPSRDWLNPALGYLVTPRARAKVRHWFRYQYFEENIAQGRDILDREVRRLGVSDVNLEKLAAKLGEPKGDEFMAAIGRGDITAHQLADAIQAQLAPVPVVEPVKRNVRSAAKADGSEILIEGVGNLPVTLARCCQPAPPAPIVGYATQGRGVTIHRRDCPNVLRVTGEREARLLSASWGEEGEHFGCEIAVEAFDRHGLLRDISDILVKEHMPVVRVNTDTVEGMATMHFQVNFTSVKQLNRALARIQALSNVVHATRINRS
ncbi:MAG: bifunctional (p)ppGpp synthetase/guanosine-3',5'-bis(diphosphate) 3'-pyrophosphohydrolase [Sulfuriferula sp.]|nr:bifunctional (p)ppGpp synthetase/guanosine-3',5'-bis(diphosphate) 3'-pyrophosphohydrolase [Sulfuriferula sp.]